MVWLWVQMEQYQKISQTTKKNATLQILIGQNQQAEKLMAEGEVEEATRLFNLTADGLQAYLEEYPDLPKDEYANLMLLSGNVYEEGGNIEKANAVYRDFVNRFPSNKAFSFDFVQHRNQPSECTRS